MNVRSRTPSWAATLLAPVVGALVLLAGAPASSADSADPVADWIRHHATPLKTTDPAAPLHDLSHLGRSIGDATIVGLGESTHGTVEETALKHRTLRYLVEQRGFRSIAWEDDWTLGIQLDRYIRTGQGDLNALVRQMSTAWHSREIADVLRWLRDYNASHTDKVRFTGVEYFTTRDSAYDAVREYVARTAPDRLDEADSHLDEIRPNTSDMGEYLRWYLEEVDNKEPYVRHARAVYDLVRELPHRKGDREYAVTLHHARQILSWYEGFSLPYLETLEYRDARAAENLRWWHRYSGDRIVYWAATPHTSNNPDQRIVVPPGPDWAFPSAGSHLRRWYGERYLSIGFTFDHGTIHDDAGEPITMPRPAPDWFERQLAVVPADQFTLDLRSPASQPVRDWLDAPAKTRGLPDVGPESYIAGGSVGQWFDVVIHRQVVTPVQPV